MQCPGQTLCIFRDFFLHRLINGVGRINGNTVSRMDAGAFDMFHNPRNQYILPVAYRIHFDFLPLQIFIHQNGVILRNPVDNLHKLFYFLIIDGNLHPLAAQHIGRAHQHRITQAVCHFFGFLGRIYGSPCRTRYPCLFQYPVKQFPVFRRVHILCLCSENRHPHLHQALCQFDSCLAAKLYNGAVRFFQPDNVFHILRSQRFKIQLIRYIKIRADRFRIVIDNNCLIARPGKRPGGMDRTIIKLNSLADPDRTGPQHKHFLFAGCLYRLVLTAKTGIVIGCAGCKLTCTGVHHFKGRRNAIVQTHPSDVRF